MRGHLRDDKLQHPLIEHAGKTEPFRNRNDIGCRYKRAVGSADAKQAFVKRDLPAL